MGAEAGDGNCSNRYFPTWKYTSFCRCLVRRNPKYGSICLSFAFDTSATRRRLGILLRCLGTGLSGWIHRSLPGIDEYFWSRDRWVERGYAGNLERHLFFWVPRLLWGPGVFSLWVSSWGLPSVTEHCQNFVWAYRFSSISAWPIHRPGYSQTASPPGPAGAVPRSDSV